MAHANGVARRRDTALASIPGFDKLNQHTHTHEQADGRRAEGAASLRPDVSLPKWRAPWRP
ncbi:hypothetical protein GCM10009809_10960 [Isoptericola hypogeus]|uniref:Uncharacterized protein n=1 Tax=Isoptericola hypogeus TaxID=300179 RepID=A0ABP4V2S2_9MICO